MRPDRPEARAGEGEAGPGQKAPLRPPGEGRITQDRQVDSEAVRFGDIGDASTVRFGVHARGRTEIFRDELGPRIPNRRGFDRRREDQADADGKPRNEGGRSGDALRTAGRFGANFGVAQIIGREKCELPRKGFEPPTPSLRMTCSTG